MAGYGICAPDLDMFRDLLYISSMRGKDSTGVTAIRSRNEKAVVTTRKITEPSPVFIDLFGGPSGYLRDLSKDVYIGHCRWATRGILSSANAHPFDLGALIGAHNGTLEDREFNVKRKTDSEMMFDKMTRDGIQPVLEGLDYLSAYAVSIYSRKTKKLYLARNKHRGLYVAYNMKRDVLYWASEASMLHLAANRNGCAIKVVFLPENNLFECDIADITAGNETPWIQTKMEVQPEKLQWWEREDWYDHQPYRAYSAGSHQSNVTAFPSSNVPTAGQVAMRNAAESARTLFALDGTYIPPHEDEKKQSVIGDLLDEIAADLKAGERTELNDDMPF